MRRRNSAGQPLAERMHFVRERGLSGWIESNRNPVLWVLAHHDGLWELRDARKVGPNDWVLPFLEFGHRYWRYQTTIDGDPVTFVKGPARFAATPPLRSSEPAPIEEQVLAAWEQVDLPI